MAAVSRPSAHAELAELYARRRTWLLAHCARRLRNRADAEDAVQQTFVYAFRSLERGVVPQHECAWLATIADNVCRNMSRRGAAAHESPGDVEHAAVADERSSTDAGDLAAALAKLPPTQRHALVLREWRGLAYREIAAELDLTEPAVETLLFRARRRAAELLAQRRRVLDVGSALSALRSLLGPAAGKVGAAAAVGCVGAAVAVPLVVTGDRPATPRQQRTAPEAARPGAPAAAKQKPAAPPRDSGRPDRPRAASHPPRTPVERPAAAPAPAAAAGDAAADHVPPRQPPAAPAPAPGAQAEPAPKRSPAPAVTTTATTPVDAVAGTASDAVDSVTAAGEAAVGTVTTAATGAVETVGETADSAAGGAAGAATGAVSGATEAVGVGTPSLPAP